MKIQRIVLVAFFLAMTATSVARPFSSSITGSPWCFGIKAGVLWSTVLPTTDDNITSVAGFVGGIFTEYAVNDWFAPSAEILYSQQGAKMVGNNDLVVEGDYVSVPLLANFYVVEGLALKTGIQPSFLVSSKLSDANEIVSMPGMLRKVDLVIPVGISYTCHFGLVIDARVNFSTITMLREVSREDNGTALSGALTLAWKF
ncbi:MAG: outer membrane beta-barrel protein [Mucinivorans sp.]